MLAYTGNASRLYNCFRLDLEEAADQNAILDIFVRLFPSLQARSVAILASNNDNSRHLVLSAMAGIGTTSLWSRYLDLCRTNREPLSRILRLSPHPVALSDIRRHARMNNRAHRLGQLLAQSGMNDAFAIPLIDQQLNFAMMIIAGRDLDLRPTKRHLMALAAADVVVRLANATETGVNQSAHNKLTDRQLEIASWLVAGKTDWEIGAILSISPKTVNFHVENIKRLYGVKSRNQFVAAIVHDGGLAPGLNFPPV